MAIPAEVFGRAAAYLDTVASDDGAGYCYTAGGPATPTMSAAGLLCRQLLGWDRRQAALLKGAARLQEALPPAPTAANSYYYHFATRVMQGIGGKEWETWESPVARVLLERQQRDGCERGSWPPGRDLYAGAGGRLMITSLSLLTLQRCGRLRVPKAGAGAKVTTGDVAAAWEDLASNDFARVKRAMEQLAGDTNQAVPLLRKRLQPAVVRDAKRIARWIDELGSDDFDTRDRAFGALTALEAQAEPALQQALKAAGPLEVRRRLERLLADIERTAVAPAWLRQRRALQILELARTPEARQLLQALAHVAPGARLTRAAQAAAARLGNRSEPRDER